MQVLIPEKGKEWSLISSSLVLSVCFERQAMPWDWHVMNELTLVCVCDSMGDGVERQKWRDCWRADWLKPPSLDSFSIMLTTMWAALFSVGSFVYRQVFLLPCCLLWLIFVSLNYIYRIEGLHIRRIAHAHTRASFLFLRCAWIADLWIAGLHRMTPTPTLPCCFNTQYIFAMFVLASKLHTTWSAYVCSYLDLAPFVPHCCVQHYRIVHLPGEWQWQVHWRLQYSSYLCM